MQRVCPVPGCEQGEQWRWGQVSVTMGASASPASEGITFWSLGPSRVALTTLQHDHVFALLLPRETVSPGSQGLCLPGTPAPPAIPKAGRGPGQVTEFTAGTSKWLGAVCSFPVSPGLSPSSPGGSSD